MQQGKTHPVTKLNPLAATALAIALFCVAAAAPNPAYAQSESPIPAMPAEGAVESAQIENAISAIEAREGLDDETRGMILEQLRSAQTQIQNKAANIAAAEQFTAQLSAGPEETASLRSALEEPAPEAPTAESLGITSRTRFTDLEQMLARSRADLANAEATLADLESRVSAEQDRPEEARARIEEIRTARTNLEQAIAAAPAPNENAMLVDARRLAASLRLDSQAAELNRLEQEILSHGVRLDLLRAQRDMAAREVATQRREVSVLQENVNAARQNDTTRLLQETALAQLEIEDKHPAIQALARETMEFGADLPAVVADIERVTNELDDIKEQARQIENMLNVSRQRLEIGGVSQAIGRLFAEERRNLPQVSQYRQQVRQRRSTLADIGLAQVRIEEERRSLTPVTERVDAVVAEIAEDVDDAAELDAIRGDVQRLLNARRTVLNQMASTYTTYLRALSDLDVEQRRLLEVAAEYKDFLDQNLLWIPNASPVNLETLTGLGPGLAFVLSPESWADVVSEFIMSGREHPIRTTLAAFLIGLALLVRRMLIKRNRAINMKVGRLSSDSILLTLQALVIAMVVALPLPLALFTIGWLLQQAPLTTDFTLAAAAGLLAVGPFLYNVRLFRILCGANGVMHTHFDWGDKMLATIRRQLDFLIAFGVPLAFVAVIAYQSPDPVIRDSLGRLAFVGVMIVIAMVFIGIANPRSGVAASFYTTHDKSWVSRLRWLWYALSAGSPIVLTILALLGFIYTASILTGEFVDTIWLVLSIIVLNLVVLRWLSLTRRKISLQRALEARAARKEEQAHADDPEHHDDEQDGPINVESKPLDLDVVDQQTRRLLQSGLFVLGVIGIWGIWSDVLPALGILEEVSVWTETVTVDGQQVARPITLADILLGLVILAVTWIASRNLPGLMEIAILQHLELQPGGRYTINTLVRYVVVTIGLITVLNTIGWSWSRIQWLVAALSVGLGFGLQEIVANFVSGLIILFERPVRVGDTVTVGNLTGSVTKVRIRATTITDWDRKEIIVPNKSFITDQVINWTLSDPITRIVIDVGISYGSDVELAHRVMEDALKAQPLILDEPAPMVYFMGFGDSSLNFKLYVFARQLSDRLLIMHAVHEDILHALRKNDIEIPFPQRDLHVRSVAPEATWNVERKAADDKNESGDS